MRNSSSNGIFDDGAVGYKRRQGLFFNSSGDFVHNQESTDLILMVEALSGEEQAPWDLTKIRNAMIREAGVEPSLAEEIAIEVEEDISRYGRKRVTTDLIREIVNVKLFQRGLDAKLKDHSRLGLPLYDLERLLLAPNRENSNTTHNPESINLSIAERILKEYALKKIFPSDVARAHLSGDIHLHDLGMVNRPYCSGQSLAYVIKYGINLPSITSVSSPAKHPEVLIAHMSKMTSVLQNNFAGAIGWDAVNMFFAPFLVGVDYKRIKQLAQMMIFEFNQLAGGRGGQVAFTDINLYYEIPKHFRNVEALGPGGIPTGKTYSEYSNEAKKFLKALFEVYLEGDERGQPFFFPKPLLHITDDFFKEPGWEECLHLACKVASEKGNTYFVFDRGGVAKLSECCRLSFELTDEDLKEASTPWKMRYSALQNVTVNLPRIAYRSMGDIDTAFALLDEALELVVKAHECKKRFLEEILSLEEEGPLAALCVKHDGEPYLRMRKASYLVGVLGLEEMIQHLTGKSLHEGQDAMDLGLAVIKYMDLKCQELSERHGLKIVIEQTPAESTAYRFAKLDIRQFPELAPMYIKGNLKTGEVYYTNSTHFAYDAPVDPVTRVVEEGRFHPMIKAGAITHVWLGESRPDPKALASLVRKIFTNTENAQVAFSPEFTVCNNCGKVQRGLQEECLSCGSKNVDGITRITGYFTKTSSWNSGKKGELKDRLRVVIQ
ncbi:anaerobic ribonucleoside-triphosphate reductase [Thermovirga sp.]|uniref:anaerobic ribonucleoside-triphosphate reductase n=1 Tax=Thermovirga sp. TaxID=2699834 RepID=UPI0025D60906|nr:anaerobic ribonucleoside-triphosphate reductase [Thermovirga sp.]MBO8153441.1 anaerobic ribonucleoside-triphosphate reductase [Thermovirga sp.]